MFLDAGQARDEADTRRTILPTSLPLVASLEFQRAFHQHYRAIRQFVAERDLGVALIAVHEDGELSGRAWVSARVDAVRTAVVGRHPSADLFLARDQTLSNRHLALVIEPVSSWEADALRFRLLDLRTGSAMWTESGERVEAIVAEGPAFVRIGNHRIMAFQTGGLDWPDDPIDAWETLPERIFVDEREAEPDRWRRGGRGKITLLPGALGSNEDPPRQTTSRDADDSLTERSDRTHDHSIGSPAWRVAGSRATL